MLDLSVPIYYDIHNKWICRFENSIMKGDEMTSSVVREKLLTAAAVAERLSLSKRAVFRMKSAGLICPSIRVGRGAIRFRESDIEQWIEWGCCSEAEFRARKEVG